MFGSESTRDYFRAGGERDRDRGEFAARRGSED